LHISTSGLSGGVDYRQSEDLTIGAGVGYSTGTTTIGGNGTAVNANDYMGAIYGSYHPVDQFFLDGVLAYGTLSYDSRRLVFENSNIVSAHRDGSEVFGSLTAGWDMQAGAWHYTTYGRINALSGVLDGTTETGDDTYALHYADQGLSSLSASFGGRFAYQFELSQGSFVPHALIEYQHEFYDLGSANVSYADWAASPTYTTKLLGIDHDRLVLGIGGDLRIDQFRLGIDYQSTMATGQESEHRLMGQLSIQW
jgi:uncharacterized protein YhjY with autotransporter beta-barrel domain